MHHTPKTDNQWQGIYNGKAVGKKTCDPEIALTSPKGYSHDAGADLSRNTDDDHSLIYVVETLR